MHLSKPWEIVKDKEAWFAVESGVEESETTQQLNNNRRSVNHLIDKPISSLPINLYLHYSFRFNPFLLPLLFLLCKIISFLFCEFVTKLKELQLFVSFHLPLSNLYAIIKCLIAYSVEELQFSDSVYFSPYSKSCLLLPLFF